jgi:hypothetical protein
MLYVVPKNDAWYEPPPAYFFACDNCEWISAYSLTKGMALMLEPECCPECGCEALSLEAQ